MNALDTIRRLWEHAFWADRLLLERFEQSEAPPPGAVREFAHVLGAEEIWLARLEARAYRAAVWPKLPLSSLRSLLRETHGGLQHYLADLREEDLAASVTYVNSAGREFSSTVADILLHAALHGQYHRGKVNLLLRQAGKEPAPTDYIAFVRGVPAATEATSKYQTE